jgi:hypothetical protein
VSDERAPLLFTSVQPDGSERSYALVMPSALARAYAADPIGVGWALTQSDYPVLRIQARAAARWGRWYGDPRASPWWSAIMSDEEL